MRGRGDAMEPWEDEAERAEFRRALVPLGATEGQAETVRLVGWQYKDGEIAKIRGVSVSTVKADVRTMFTVLKVTPRDRCVMGRVARRLVEARRVPRERPSSREALPLPELKFAKRRRRGAAGRSAGRVRGPDGHGEPPAHEAPEA